MNEYNLDDILAEFSSFSETLTGAVIESEPEPKEAPAPMTEEAPKAEEKIRFTPAHEAPVYYDPLPFEAEKDEEEEEEPSVEDIRIKADREAFAKIVNKPAVKYPAPEAAVKKQAAKPIEAPQYKETEEDEEEYEEYEKPAFKKPHFVVRMFIALLFCMLSAAVIIWSGLKLSLDHGSAGSSAVASAETAIDLSEKLNVFVNNSTADALGDLAFIKKIYTIPASATVAPAPIASSYGTVGIDNAAAVLDVIEQARRSGLLDGQDVIFDPNVEFYPYADIEYYCDDTILVICWKQMVDGRICSCSEVKIADASQLRRKIVNDTFGSGERLFATELAASCNAVVAMNADFYGFRDLGLSVYNGQICRYDNHCDVLYIDRNGDFLIQRRSDIMSREDTEQFLADNGILFSIAFGPVIIENGEPQYLTDGYGGLGEMGMEYSRACIAQYDSLHYLYVAVSHSDSSMYAPRATVNQFADIITTFGVKTAYNLDGGQTGELVFNGVPYNHIDFGSERTVSDVIYFATALPEDQR